MDPLTASFFCKAAVLDVVDVDVVRIGKNEAVVTSIEAGHSCHVRHIKDQTKHKLLQQPFVEPQNKWFVSVQFAQENCHNISIVEAL